MKRLAILAVGVSLVVLSRCGGSPNVAASPPSTRVVTTETAPKPTTTRTTVATADNPTVDVSLAPAAEAVTRQFVTAWMTPGTVESRTASMAPVALPELVHQVVSVPADELPTGPVTVTFHGSDGYTATVDVQAGTQRFTVTLIETAPGWRVAGMAWTR